MKFISYMLRCVALRITTLLMVVMLCCGLDAFGQTVDDRQTMDKRDLITREWNTDVRTNVKFLDHETIYDSDGRKIEETEYSKLGKLWTKKYEYGEDGRVSRELTYNELGRLDNIQTFEYNEFGKKKAVCTYDAKGKMVRIKVFEYKYREHDK